MTNDAACETAATGVRGAGTSTGGGKEDLMDAIASGRFDFAGETRGGAPAAGLGGPMEGTLTGAPLVLLFFLGFVTLAWAMAATASSKPSRCASERDKEAVLGTQQVLPAAPTEPNSGERTEIRHPRPIQIADRRPSMQANEPTSSSSSHSPSSPLPRGLPPLPTSTATVPTGGGIPTDATNRTAVMPSGAGSDSVATVRTPVATTEIESAAAAATGVDNARVFNVSGGTSATRGVVERSGGSGSGGGGGGGGGSGEAGIDAIIRSNRGGGSFSDGVGSNGVAPHSNAMLISGSRDYSGQWNCGVGKERIDGGGDGGEVRAEGQTKGGRTEGDTTTSGSYRSDPCAVALAGDDDDDARGDGDRGVRGRRQCQCQWQRQWQQDQNPTDPELARRNPSSEKPQVVAVEEEKEAVRTTAAALELAEAEVLAEAEAEAKEIHEQDVEERMLLARVKTLLQELERNLDAARVLLPECHRFRKVVGCVAEAVGPGMGASSRQAMDLKEALEEAAEFTRTLSSPESFVLVLAELLSDGFEDPSAMLGSSTRRLHRAVSALSEPSSVDESPAVAVSARAQLRSIATATAAGGIINGLSGASSHTRSASFGAAATAAAVAAAAAPPPAAPLTSSSSATATISPVSLLGLSVSSTSVGAGAGSTVGGAVGVRVDRTVDAPHAPENSRDRNTRTPGPNSDDHERRGNANVIAGVSAISTATGLTNSTPWVVSAPVAAVGDGGGGVGDGGVGGGDASGGGIGGGTLAGLGDSAGTEHVDINDEDVSTTCGGGGGGGGAGGGGGGGGGGGSDGYTGACGGTGGGGGGPDDPPRTMGPSLTSEAAGLSELIRRRGGMAALTDGRTVAAVLRAAAPRRAHSFQQQLQQLQQAPRPRIFFDTDAAEDDGAGAGAGVGAGMAPGGVNSLTPLLGVEGVGRDMSRPGEDGEEEGGGGGGEVVEGSGSGSLYVSATCGGFFGARSPQVESSSDRGTLPWPSPQDANGVCQRLAKRVEARVEAMVPFAFPNPAPACERRRIRLVNNFFFSVMARNEDPFTLTTPTSITTNNDDDDGSLSRNGLANGFGAGIISRGSGASGAADAGSSSLARRPIATMAGRRRGRAGGHWEGRGGVVNRPSPDFEGRLYAVLGALLEAARELVPGAREGGAAVNAVGETTVLTLKGCCALDRAPSTRDTSLSTIPRRTSMCQHAVCTPRVGRKTLEGGTRQEDGVLLVPDCRKLRQEIVRSTCMDPAGRIRPDYVGYAGAPIYADGAPLGTFCIYSRKTLKELGWTAHHTAILRGLADAASTEMLRICRLAELDDQRDQQRRRRRASSESPQQSSQHRPGAALCLAPRWRSGVGDGNGRVGLTSQTSSSLTFSPTPSHSATINNTEMMTSLSAAGGSASDMVAGAPAMAAAAAAVATDDGAGGLRVAQNGSTTGVRGGVVGGLRAESASHISTGAAADGGDVAGAGGVGVDNGTGVGVSGVVGTTPILESLDGIVSPPMDSRRVGSNNGLAGDVQIPSLSGRASSAELSAFADLTGSPAEAGAGSGTAVLASTGVQEGGPSNNLWHRALRKLKIKKRKNSSSGVSDNGGIGSSAGLDISRGRRRSDAGGSTAADSRQVFVERSRA